MDKDNSPIPRLSEFECLPEDTQKQIFDTIKSNNDISRRLLIEKVNAVAGTKFTNAAFTTILKRLKAVSYYVDSFPSNENYMRDMTTKDIPVEIDEADKSLKLQSRKLLMQAMLHMTKAPGHIDPSAKDYLNGVKSLVGMMNDLQNDYSESTDQGISGLDDVFTDIDSGKVDQPD